MMMAAATCNHQLWPRLQPATVDDGRCNPATINVVAVTINYR